MRARFPYSDYTQNRILGGLGYVLFFLPLLFCPDSRYGRFCANQGLIGLAAILIVMLSGWLLKLIIGWLPLVSPLISALVVLVRAAVGLCMVYFAYLAIMKDDVRELPFIGSCTILH